MNLSVCIVGNSVSILIHPPRVAPHEKTYCEILRDRGFTVIHAGKQAVVAADLYRYLEDEVVRHFPDHVILHFGIVECTCRARPRWLQNFFSLNDWTNSIVGGALNSERTRFAKIVLRKIYRRLIERPLYAAGVSWRWLSPDDFRRVYLDVIQRLFRETAVKKIQLVGITPVTDELERRVPGTRASTKMYNAVMVEISRTVPDVLYVDVDTPEFAPLSMDGIHLTAEGHELLARRIEANLTGERTAYAAWGQIKAFPLEDKLRRWAAGRSGRPWFGPGIGQK